MAQKSGTQEKAKTLIELIGYYEICIRAEGKSERTIQWYSANLKRFLNYVKSRHLPCSINNIDIKLLRQYTLHLQKVNKYEGHPYTPVKSELLSTATVHGHVRTLRAFFNWLVGEEFIDNNVARNLKLPKVAKKLITTLSDEEIHSILSVLKPINDTIARNQTIFMVLIDTGLRLGELINLKMEDTHLHEGFLKVMGKGNKERIVPIGISAQRAIKRYLFRYRPKPTYQGFDNVFLSIHGIPLSGNSVKLMFARLAQRSGVHRLHAHLCRHTFATRFLINGGDVFTLQQILGHSTLEMVKHYVNLASSHVAIQHQKFSPLDRLNLRGV
jgi:integrase/recombinase XerC/integrase/recombinase XerD